MGSMLNSVAIISVTTLLTILWTYLDMKTCRMGKLMGSMSTSVALINVTNLLILMCSSILYEVLQAEQVDWLHVNFCSNNQ